uniref:Uncharacterized protein n=1 Tax=Chromera velia CCMP2878 TaxID=1169474 RepID=A0A0G4I131_9ALVE|eukprot:Cvel_11.t1-p1 / transcript=Cvel_11.t1 / gene=Cvel_11 / organism=Chromera_velia_CCMP2878 / gene_product=hypothetical protein / transcript_product=hypothetical protein / location=Cvel_scaffold5:63225-78303(+) / protein_length=1311 / sequence_SO=supercontig / SO=protein_coding / is_pseudo=false
MKNQFGTSSLIHQEKEEGSEEDVRKDVRRVMAALEQKMNGRPVSCDKSRNYPDERDMREPEEATNGGPPPSDGHQSPSESSGNETDNRIALETRKLKRFSVRDVMFELRGSQSFLPRLLRSDKRERTRILTRLMFGLIDGQGVIIDEENFGHEYMGTMVSSDFVGNLLAGFSPSVASMFEESVTSLKGVLNANMFRNFCKQFERVYLVVENNTIPQTKEAVDFRKEMMKELRKVMLDLYGIGRQMEYHGSCVNGFADKDSACEIHMAGVGGQQGKDLMLVEANGTQTRIDCQMSDEQVRVRQLKRTLERSAPAGKYSWNSKVEADADGLPFLSVIAEHSDFEKKLDFPIKLTFGEPDPKPVRAARLLRAYAEIEPACFQLGLLVKVWAYARGLICAENGGLSADAWMYMVIFFLQTRKGGKRLLPNLQNPPKKSTEGSEGDDSDEEEARDPNYFFNPPYADKSRAPEVLAEPFTALRPRDLSGIPSDDLKKPGQKVTLMELLLGFFHFYSVEFSVHSEVIVIGDGHRTTKADICGLGVEYDEEMEAELIDEGEDPEKPSLVFHSGREPVIGDENFGAGFCVVDPFEGLSDFIMTSPKMTSTMLHEFWRGAFLILEFARLAQQRQQSWLYRAFSDKDLPKDPRDVATKERMAKIWLPKIERGSEDAMGAECILAIFSPRPFEFESIRNEQVPAPQEYLQSHHLALERMEAPDSDEGAHLGLPDFDDYLDPQNYQSLLSAWERGYSRNMIGTSRENAGRRHRREGFAPDVCEGTLLKDSMMAKRNIAELQDACFDALSDGPLISEACLGFCTDYVREVHANSIAHSALDFPLNREKKKEWCLAFGRKQEHPNTFPCPFGPFCRKAHRKEELANPNLKSPIAQVKGELEKGILMHAPRERVEIGRPCHDVVLTREWRRWGATRGFGPCRKGESCKFAHYVQEVEQVRSENGGFRGGGGEEPRETQINSRRGTGGQARLCWRMFLPFGCWEGLYLCQRAHCKPLPPVLDLGVLEEQKDRKRAEPEGVRWLAFLVRRWLERCAYERGGRDVVERETQSLTELVLEIESNARASKFELLEVMSLSSFLQEMLRIIRGEWRRRDPKFGQSETYEASVVTIFRFRVALSYSLKTLIMSFQDFSVLPFLRFFLYDSFILIGEMDETESHARRCSSLVFQDNMALYIKDDKNRGLSEAGAGRERDLFCIVAESIVELHKQSKDPRVVDAWKRALEACGPDPNYFYADIRGHLFHRILTHAPCLPEGIRLEFLRIFFAPAEQGGLGVNLTLPNPTQENRCLFESAEPQTQSELRAAGWLRDQ